MTDSNHHMLRHMLTALAYRGSNIFQDMTPELATFRPDESVRTPVEILSHMSDVLEYARSFYEGYEISESTISEWDVEVERFYTLLDDLNGILERQEPLKELQLENLLLGPFSDCMLHLGQIGIFRRMAGSPVEAENYAVAEVATGSLRKPRGLS